MPLALAATDVGGAVHAPRAVDLFLEVAAARPRQRTDAVEVLAADGNEQTRVAVARRVFDAHRHAADRVDERLEALEIDLEVMVHGYTERTLHRAHDDRRAVAVCRVDPVGASRVADLHPQVARNRQQ